MFNSLTLARFSTLLQQLNCQLPNTQAVWQALLCAYTEPQRHYHTTQHLHECLQQFDRYHACAAIPAEVEFALWFHDSVYQPQAIDNEAKSAQWAIAVLQQGKVCENVQRRIKTLILATQHDFSVPQTADEKLLVDIDLAIFAASAVRFAEYQQQIQAEYTFVPAPVYQEKRPAFLQTMLERDVLYHTAAVKADLEMIARDNLQYHSVQF